MKFLLLALLTISCVTTPPTKEEKQVEIYYQQALSFNLKLDKHVSCITPKIYNETAEPILPKHIVIYRTITSVLCLRKYDNQLPCVKEIYKTKPFNHETPEDGLSAFCIGPK